MNRRISRQLFGRLPAFLISGRTLSQCVFYTLRCSTSYVRVVPSATLYTQSRAQSSSVEKKFHCSICKKAFRLEMAAKLHLQQAHCGDGSIELGAGPCDTPEAPRATGPPQVPTQMPVFAEEERKVVRRSRPTPKPLHEPDHSISDVAMQELLTVWDSIGVKRLGDGFVHSSMVMKVFAASPEDGVDHLYAAVSPEGSDPFVLAADTQCASSSVPSDSLFDVYAVTYEDAYALATENGLRRGPFRCAASSNPLVRTIFVPSPAAQNSALNQRPSKSETTTAPVTPFGQLPLFGQDTCPTVSSLVAKTAIPPTATTNTASVGDIVASPFASSPVVGISPFAGAATSQPTTPFPTSPFSAEIEAATTSSSGSPSPFTNAEVASPFLSPAALAFAPSPFIAAGEMPAQDPAQWLGQPMSAGLEGAAGFSQATFTSTTEATEHKCGSCDRTFSTYEGMRMHSKAKHDVDLPSHSTKSRKRLLPDLPAYVPSPVDLTMTTPFRSHARESCWTETEIVPHAQSIANTTIVGVVLDIELLDDDSSQVTVFVNDNNDGSGETLVLRCVGECHEFVDASIRRQDIIFAAGSLRLLPVFESSTEKNYSVPVIMVSQPTGMIAKVSK